MKSILAFLTLSCLTVPLVQAADVQISSNQGPQLWTCHVPEKSAKVLSTEPKEMNGRHVVIVRLDRNYDQAQDAMFIYEVSVDGQRQPFPHYYIYDKNFDGMPDSAFMDLYGNGICSQMREISVDMALGNGEKDA